MLVHHYIDRVFIVVYHKYWTGGVSKKWYWRWVISNMECIVSFDFIASLFAWFEHVSIMVYAGQRDNLKRISDITGCHDAYVKDKLTGKPPFKCRF